MLPTFIGISLFVTIITAQQLPESRIVNGSDSYNAEYPFMVSIRGSLNYHSCGGSIISPEWILTAAHCVPVTNITYYSIQYGEHIISYLSESVAYVEKIIVHEQYNPYNQFINDIALFKLTKPLKYKHNVQPIKLPSRCQKPIAGTTGRLLGWGLNATGGIVPAILQQVDLKIILQPECAKLHFKTVHLRTVCAGDPDGIRGQCSGDSGGPLIDLRSNAIIGIVSWSIKPCVVAPFPGVLTDVSEFRDWIKARSGV